MKTNKLIPTFFVALKERYDDGILIVYEKKEKCYFDTSQEAREYYLKLVHKNEYTEHDIEVIKLWKIETF